MPVLKHRVLPVVAGAAIVVGGADLTAYAANGHPLLLGHANNESHTAAVTNHGSGPALSITTRDDTPPLEVSSQAKVRHLNADRVDGKNASQLQTRARTFTLPRGTDAPFSFLLKGVKPGTYLATYDVILDNTGSVEPRCTLEVNGKHDVLSGRGFAPPTIPQAAVSASALLEVGRKASVFIGCQNADAIADDAQGDPSTVTLLTVDQDTAGSVAAD